MGPSRVGPRRCAGHPRESRADRPHPLSRVAAGGRGYASLAPDLLSEESGTTALGDPANATPALSWAPQQRLLADLRARLDELARRLPQAKLAAIGFCFGGGLTWSLLAAGDPAWPLPSPSAARRRPTQIWPRTRTASSRLFSTSALLSFASRPCRCLLRPAHGETPTVQPDNGETAPWPSCPGGDQVLRKAFHRRDRLRGVLHVPIRHPGRSAAPGRHPRSAYGSAVPPRLSLSQGDLSVFVRRPLSLAFLMAALLALALPGLVKVVTRLPGGTTARGPGGLPTLVSAWFNAVDYEHKFD